MDLSEISAVAADAERADVFQIPQGSPLLYIDELGYNFVGQPILYSQEYYANGIFKHTILRKNINTPEFCESSRKSALFFFRKSALIWWCRFDTINVYLFVLQIDTTKMGVLKWQKKHSL